jgi:serine/threonine protein kinase/tetratricopeptide (TPR) repeat protein
MSPEGTNWSCTELDDFIQKYEAAWARGDRLELTAFLPEPGHPLRRSVLRELVRIDLEYHWTSGQPRPLDAYRTTYPEVFDDQESLDAITFEEYRLRRQAGEDASPAEYASRFGADVSAWPSPHSAGAGADPALPPLASDDTETRLTSSLLDAAARAMQEWRRRSHGPGGAAAKPSGDPFASASDHSNVCDESRSLVQADADDADPEVPAMPRVGGALHGFHLLAELGRGTFARVYLCRQGDLADRLVVLKIVLHDLGETRMLAQLQHSHIVPIYSVHQTNTYHAICMPFLGITTLRDILDDLREQPTMPASGKYLLDRISARTQEQRETWGCPDGQSGDSGPAEARTALENMTYVEGILWLAARLASGLVHAHERGIVHKDLKPANILLTNNAQPMLLDFNLSEDAKLHRPASESREGGTLPYMAPEQLAAVKKGIRAGDERSDLYSFGIILYELLTRRHPFAELDDRREEALRALFANRDRLPEVRCWNPAVSPAAESIVRHCLEVNPSRRYQTALALQEDLERQLQDRPLKHASEPSLQERARKWMRRHPRLSSSTSVALVATFLILALAGTFLLRVRQLRRWGIEQEYRQTQLMAVTTMHSLRDDLKTVEVLLGTDVADAERDQREEGIALARGILDRYRVLESPAWQETKLVAPLADDQRRQLKEDMGELLLLLAGAVARQAQVDFALELNARALDCFPTGSVPRALWQQRAELARSAGRAEEARDLEQCAQKATAQPPRDRYLFLLAQYRNEGRLPEALPLLQQASRRLNNNFSVWMILGNCYAEIGKFSDAVECYDMASALWPEALWPYLCGGLACLDKRDYQRARAAFNEVVRLRPEMLQAYYNRALAEFYLGDLSAARADLTRVLSDAKPPLRAYFLRAKVRARQGDREGARRDQEDGLQGEPRDEQDLTARGLARQSRDPRAALADYESALKLNPRCRAAYQNKANVLAENLGRTEEAIKALDQVLALYPNYVPARAGRGVLHARLGRREAAHADARETLRRNTEPFTIYQVAGVYALTSRQEPADRQEAFRLLNSTLNQGFGLDLIESDRDLDAIRDQPEFRQMVEAARLRRVRAAPRPGQPQTNFRRDGPAGIKFLADGTQTIGYS